jgi:Fic family protein
MTRYFWQQANWPDFSWDSDALLQPLGRARQAQGRLLAEAEPFDLELQADVLTEEAFTTAAIEGEKLDRDSVRSSVARRLGLPTAGLPPVERHVDGLVEMLLDATVNHGKPLCTDRIKGWQAALFPTGFSGMNKITVGNWRQSISDPMQVVSGPIGREKIHFEAPPANRLASEIQCLIDWFHNKSEDLDGLVRAAMAHLWFVTIHPFADGNGRLARALTDMALAQDEKTGCRLYSMSAQIIVDHKDYYAVLERTQKSDGDITEWLVWFLGCLERAIYRSEKQIQKTLQKAKIWQRASLTTLNARQQKVINRLLDAGPGGFEGGLTTRKYRGMTKTSQATAKRDISELLEKGVLTKNSGGGRSVSYDLVWYEN